MTPRTAAAGLLTVGFLSLLAQVVLLRELSVAMYGVELIYPLALGAWLLWTATGALVSARLLRPSPRRLTALFLLLAVFLPADVAFLRASRNVLGAMRGAYLPLADQAAVLLGTLLPPGLLLGLAFQWCARLYVGTRHSLARAYAIESVGAVAGGLAATALLAIGIQNFTAMLGCSIVAAAGAFLPAGGPPRRVVRTGAALAAGSLLAAIVQANAIDRWMTSWTHPHLAGTWDSPYGRVTVEELQGQISVFENDALAFDTESTAAEELAHLSAIQRSRPDAVLILGGGISGLVREVARHQPARIDAVELNDVLVKQVVARLSPELQESLRAPGVRLLRADPRRFLSACGVYDLIIVGMPDPTSAQANRFYTREFFALLRQRLRPQGVVAFRLTSSENYLPPPKAQRLASIHRAVSALFSHVVVLPMAGGSDVVLASRAPLSRDGELLARRLGRRHVEARLVIPAYVRYIYANDRFFKIEERIRTERALVPTNTDARPVCFRYSALIWLSKFVSAARLAELEDTAQRVSWRLAGGIAALAAAALFLASRLRPALRRCLLAAAAGFTGMILETVLLLHYQVKNGVIFQDIGVLLMLFMAGLAAGAVSVDHFWPRLRGRRLWGAVLLVILAGLCASWAVAASWGVGSSLAAVGAGLAGTGFLTAAVFAYVSLHGVADAAAVISPLYAADLAGGCLAAVAGALAAVPALGLAATLGAVAVLSLLALLLV